MAYTKKELINIKTDLEKKIDRLQRTISRIHQQIQKARNENIDNEKELDQTKIILKNVNHQLKEIL